MKILCLSLVSFSDALRNGVRIIGGHDADENWFHEEILKDNRTLNSEKKTLIKGKLVLKSKYQTSWYQNKI